jgi:hypothetical protein
MRLPTNEPMCGIVNGSLGSHPQCNSDASALGPRWRVYLTTYRYGSTQSTLGLRAGQTLGITCTMICITIGRFNVPDDVKIHKVLQHVSVSLSSVTCKNTWILDSMWSIALLYISHSRCGIQNSCQEYLNYHFSTEGEKANTSHFALSVFVTACQHPRLSSLGHSTVLVLINEPVSLRLWTPCFLTINIT